jgi:hypothetical protein
MRQSNEQTKGTNTVNEQFAEQIRELRKKYGDVEDFYIYSETNIHCRYANLRMHKKEDGWHLGELPGAYPTPAECYGRWWEGGA